MERVLIFGNTPESRSAARMLRQRGRQVVMSVTSEYARTLLPPGTLCYVGKLNGAGMLALIGEVAPHRVVDATHPYAVIASQNISAHSSASTATVTRWKIFDSRRLGLRVSCASASKER